VSTAQLLREAAKVLDNHGDPLSEWFLSENEVTLDQAMALGTQLALGARIVAKALEKPRSQQGLAMFQTLVEDS
jgi:hypothetical protein